MRANGGFDYCDDRCTLVWRNGIRSFAPHRFTEGYKKISLVTALGGNPLRLAPLADV
jgi:hypothetical protein